MTPYAQAQRAALYGARLKRRFRPRAEAPREPESCDNLSLDSVRGIADTLGVGIDEARRLLAHNHPEDWQA